MMTAGDVVARDFGHFCTPADPWHEGIKKISLHPLARLSLQQSDADPGYVMMYCPTCRHRYPTEKPFTDAEEKALQEKLAAIRVDDGL